RPSLLIARNCAVASNKKALPRWGGPFGILRQWLIHLNAAAEFLLLGRFVGLACAGSLLDPVVGLREVGLACRIVAAFQVGLAAIGEVQIVHGVVIVRIDADRLVEVLHCALDQVGVRSLQLRANFLRLFHIALAVVGHAGSAKDRGRVLIRLGPI